MAHSRFADNAGQATCLLQAEISLQKEYSPEIIKKWSAEAERKYLKYRSDVAAVLARVNQARVSSMDCEEGEQSVSFLTEQRAEELILDIVQRADEEHLKFYWPSVSSTPQGYLGLSWNHAGRWVVVTVVPPYESHICVTRTPEGESQREELSERGTVNRVLGYFRTRQESHD